MKLLLALIVVAIFGYSMAQNECNTDHELTNIVKKYKEKATGNAEFSQWIEKVYYASTKSCGNLPSKVQIVRNFKAYDEKRQHIEDQLTSRITEIESELINHKLSDGCRSLYLGQRDILSKAYKYSNDKKQSILNENSQKCERKKKKKKCTKECSNSSKGYNWYDYWYSWFWG